MRLKMASSQPDWVCTDCGCRWGSWWDGPEYTGPAHHRATFHVDRCGVCGNTKIVTEARDFGYLKEGWDRKLND